MNKQKLLNTFIEKLEQDLLMIKEAARVALDAATNEESKPENEYDTRALEASYLAGAQAKRAAEIDAALSLFKNIHLQSFANTDAILATALIELRHKNQKSTVLLMPLGGGLQVSYEGVSVQVVTPSSILGEALIGLRSGDTAEVEIADQIKEYEILNVQ